METRTTGMFKSLAVIHFSEMNEINGRILESFSNQKEELIKKIQNVSFTSYMHEFISKVDSNEIEIYVNQTPEDIAEYKESLLKLINRKDLDKLVDSSVKKLENINSNKLIKRFKKDLEGIFEKAQKTIMSHEKITQAIILTYDGLDEPIAQAYGYEPAKFPVFYKPEYIDTKLLFNETFEYIENLSLRNAWKGLDKIKFMFEFVQVEYTWDLFQLYKINSYILLNKAFQELVNENFIDSLRIKTPLFVYFGAHDCEENLIFYYE